MKLGAWKNFSQLKARLKAKHIGNFEKISLNFSKDEIIKSEDTARWLSTSIW